MNVYYVLDRDGNPVLEPDLMAWARWLETADRRLAFTALQTVEVSTVFLGIDHSFGDGLPVLWETMVFGPEGRDEDVERYTSREDALAGHDRMVARYVRLEEEGRD